jgi:hypothetical protein
LTIDNCVDVTKAPYELQLTAKIEDGATLVSVGSETEGSENSEISTFLGIGGTERQYITSIEFQSTVPASCTYGNPISVGTDSTSVMACVSEDKTEILIGQNGGVKANPDSSLLFAHLYAAPTITGLKEHTTAWHNVINMESMFDSFASGNTSITELALPEFPDYFGAGAAMFRNMFASVASGATNLTSLTMPDLPKGFCTLNLYHEDYGTRNGLFFSFGSGTIGLTAPFTWNEANIAHHNSMEPPGRFGLFSGMVWGPNGKILVTTKLLYDQLNSLGAAGHVEYAPDE